MNKPIESRPEVWSNKITITDHYNVELTAKILGVCNVLRETTNGNEFSILCRGSWINNVYTVGNEYVIPLQKVDRCSVYYDEDDLHTHRVNGFNVVIHCHPFKSNWFSRTDSTTINANFDCSVLYSEGAFTTAVIPLNISSDFILQVSPKTIFIDWTQVADVDLDIAHSNITYLTTRQLHHTQTTLDDHIESVFYIDHNGMDQTVSVDDIPDDAIYDDETGIYVSGKWITDCCKQDKNVYDGVVDNNT